LHKGFIVQKLSKEEIDNSLIKIVGSDKELFPDDGVIFFIESYDEIYGCYLTSSNEISGLEDWFNQFPIAKDDLILISKYSEGFYLSTMSDIVEQQQHFAIEMDRVLSLEPTDIFCPNCRYNLEHAGRASRDDSYILKCARCGFTLVKKRLVD